MVSQLTTRSPAVADTANHTQTMH